MIESIDEQWIAANPAAALAMLERVLEERDNAVNLATAVANDSAQLRRDLALASCAGRKTDILHRIEAHLRATGTTSSGFGMAAIGDPALVAQLREGRTLRPATEARVRAYLDPLDAAAA